MLDVEAVLYYHDNPEDFCLDINGFEATPQQKILFDILPKAIEESKSISVKAGHGVGKTAISANIIIWFMATRPNPKIVCTAPTKAQLMDVLWPELAKWHKKSKLKDLFEWTKTRFTCVASPEDWFASARTSREPTSMAGIHGESVLYIIDEASGVDQKIFEVLEGGETESGSLKILMSNPTQITGEFYDSFHSKKEFYYNLTFSCLESPRVKPEYAKKIAAKYGKDSDVYRIRVLGEFPKGNPDGVIPLWLLEKAAFDPLENIEYDKDDPLEYEKLICEFILKEIKKNNINKIEFGVDVARFGDDASTIFLRVGYDIYFISEIKGMDTNQLAKKIANIANTYFEEILKIINVDVVGIGAGTVDTLKNLIKDGLLKNAKVYGIANNGKSLNKKEYANKITEMYFNFKYMLKDFKIEKIKEKINKEGNFDDKKQFRIQDIPQLFIELSARRYRFAQKTQMILEKKNEFKKRVLKSPDFADGCILTLHSLIYNIEIGFGTTSEKIAIDKKLNSLDINNFKQRLQNYRLKKKRKYLL